MLQAPIKNIECGAEGAPEKKIFWPEVAVSNERFGAGGAAEKVGFWWGWAARLKRQPGWQGCLD